MLPNFPFTLLAISALFITLGAVEARHVGRSHASRWTPSRRRIGLRTEGYVTEPNFFPQIFKIEHLSNDSSLLSPGYIFVSNMYRIGADFGPQIYALDGELVWYGSVLSNQVLDFKVCDYEKTKQDSHAPQLCWTEREVVPDERRIVHKVIVNNDYSLVKNMTAERDVDVHEFRLLTESQSFITIDYRLTKADLTAYYGKASQPPIRSLSAENGYFKDCCIVEYDIETYHINFEWCYSDHLPLWETTIFPHQSPQVNDTSNIAGAGTEDKPWDAIHLNAVDKNTEGDYLGSFRHTDQLIKIAGPNSASGKPAGTMLWRLGGLKDDFDHDFNFSKPHDVRFVRPDSAGDTFSVFDNAWDGVNEPSSTYSSGKIIHINNNTMQAELLQEYPHPHGSLVGSRGSMQILDNGNAFVGWGKLPEMSEYTKNGTPIFHARFAAKQSKQFSYRTFKYPWKGDPPWSPKLVAYSYSCVKDQRKPLYVYISWNGATEVTDWRIYVAQKEKGPWLPAGTFPKKGFETRITLKDPVPYVSAQALDQNGNVLSSVSRKTFVPQTALQTKCDEFGCPNHFVYNDDASRAEQCEQFQPLSIIPLVLILAFLEVSVQAMQNLLCRSTHASVHFRDTQFKPLG